MKSELKEISATQKELHIRIEADAFKSAYGSVSQKYARGASVPGFRKGFAPVDVVRLRYQEEIKNEVLQTVLPERVSAAIEEHSLRPLTEPHMHLVNAETVKVNGSEPIEMHVHVEVMPEIPVPKYEKLSLIRRVKPVEDGEIDDLIAERLQKEAALIPVEGRASEIGDTVIADLEGTFDDDPNGEVISADNLEIVLGDEIIEKAFTENLVGVSEDEEKNFTVTYPAEFSSPALAGKTVHYRAKIKSVGRSETPELNDDWAQSLDEGYESLADLRAKLRADLEVYARLDADARLRNDAMATLIEQNSFEVPTTLIESQARNLLNNFAQDLRQRGTDLNTANGEFLQMIFAQMRTQAERDVRGAILLDKVAEAESIAVGDDEVNEEVSKLADHYRTTPDEIRDSLKKQDGAATIENNLRTRKAIEAIVAKAEVSDADWIDESAEIAADNSAADAREKATPVKAKVTKKGAAKTKAQAVDG